MATSPQESTTPSDQQITSGMSQEDSHCKRQGDEKTQIGLQARPGQQKTSTMGMAFGLAQLCTKSTNKTSTTINLF